MEGNGVPPALGMPAQVSTTWALIGWAPRQPWRGHAQPISAHVVLTCVGIQVKALPGASGQSYTSDAASV